MTDLSIKEGLELLHASNVDVKYRRVYATTCGDEEGTSTILADNVIKNLMYLDSLSNKDITLVVNNGGGDVTAGLSIYDAIRLCKSHVTAFISGEASSIASIFIQAADSRIMTESSSMMIHSGQICIPQMSYPNARRLWKEFERVEKVCLDIYMSRIQEKNPDFNRLRLERMMDPDTYLDPDKALELGLIDKVV